MTKLSEKERESFEKIFNADLNAINAKFMNQIKDFWALARAEVLKRKGWDKLMQEKQSLEIEQLMIRNRIHEIENTLNKKDLKPEQVVELGGKPNEYGRFDGANFYGIPVTSQFEYEIVEYIRQNMDIEIPAKILRDVCQASIRALAMSGTFEDARATYEKFYSLNFRKYGVDIPPRLEELTKDKKLLDTARESLVQIERKIDEPAQPPSDSRGGSA